MDRYLMISTDGHAGLPMEGYRNYLESKHHAAFDRELPLQREATAQAEEMFLISDFNQKWREGIEDDLKAAWDPMKREKVMDSEGIAAEVLFPDGITEMNTPPFGAGLSLKHDGVDPELQWAGARAHNRWMAEFCADNPDRRIGLAVVLTLWGVDQALEEVKLAHKNGMKGILIPSLTGNHPGYNDVKYYPIWEYCEANGLVVHTHSGPSPDYDFMAPGAMGVYLTEFAGWAARPSWYMIFGGVFEKFPKLKFCITEVSEFWVPSMLEMMDVRASVRHTTGKLGDYRSNLTMKPSEYFQRNCYVSASAHFDEGSTAVRHQIGIENVMWGSDFPHPEGSWPNTRAKLTEVMSGIPEAEITMMLSSNASRCYDLDEHKLIKIAERIGPAKSEFVG